jgi:hypothetical protein
VNPIQKLMLSMFIHLRIGVGVVGLSLPWVLLIGGWAIGVSFAGSMSAYYHATPSHDGVPGCSLPKCTGPKCALTPSNSACQTQGEGPMRNWFVGNLFFIGAAMFLMKGFSRWENWALNIAGIAAPCVALFPMGWPCTACGFSIHSLHYPSAITFFVCAGFTCVFCSEKTLKYIPVTLPNYKKVVAFYRRWYRILGTIMLVTPAVAWVVTHITRDDHAAFYLEAAGVMAFGAFWLFKTFELKRSDIERKAILGLAPLNPKTLF